MGNGLLSSSIFRLRMNKSQFLLTTIISISAKMKTLLKYLVLLACCSIANAQQTDSCTRVTSGLEGPYLGQKVPGKIPEIFAPGIVSIDGVQSKLLITPDGFEIIFQNMISAVSSPNDRKISFVCIKMENDHWGLPIHIPFSLEYTNDEPALSPDGQKLFFVSNRPKDGSNDPQRMPDIWVSERISNGWGFSKNIGAPVNTDGVEVQPFYSIDNKLYYGRSDGIYYSQYSNEHFSEPVKFDDNIFKGRVRGVCISPDNEILIVHSDMTGGYGRWDLYISFKDQTGRWTKLINMGNSINTEQAEANATFSPDGKYLFFTRGDDIYWVSAKIIEELRPKE